MPTANTDQSVRDELVQLRQSIDNIDAAVVHMLAERFKRTRQVGRLKAAHRLPPADPSREAVQLARLRGLAESAQLAPGFVEKLLTFVIAEVIKEHEALALRPQDEESTAAGRVPRRGPAAAALTGARSSG
ncbi:chorismate mutase [Streptomyces montanus]|uniref:Chorismate mutase n=1 Tax=Streptomyces montanus TaxID=2580423 RepID=A0A5R9FZL7_9ACTN|nr:chorismate mutase [Streptomyces montanus]TLS47370.1 chorismate mutase [Streptomyces montanus]